MLTPFVEQSLIFHGCLNNSPQFKGSGKSIACKLMVDYLGCVGRIGAFGNFCRAIHFFPQNRND